MAVAWALLSGLVLPSSLIASSVSEFSDIGSFGNPAVFLWYSCFQSLGLFVFWPLCIFFLFKERVQTLLTVLFSMGFVCSVVNAFLFVVNYGPMDIKFVFFNGLVNLAPSYMILNVCILIVTVVLLYYTLTKFNGRFLSPICIVLILAFSLFGFINITSIMKDYSVLKTEQISDVVRENDIKPEFHFTQTGKNIVVIMLDKAAGAYFEAILQDKPELGKIFDGFKYSMREEGTAFCISYSINKASLDLYKKYNLNANISYGVIASKPPMNDEKLLSYDNGELVASNNNAILVDIDFEYSGFDFVISGFKADGSQDKTPIVACAYVTDGTNIYYISASTDTAPTAITLEYVKTNIANEE